MAFDPTQLCLRLAARVDTSVGPHRVVAAMALTARGHEGVDCAEFARRLDLPVELLERVEHGRLGWDELPEQLMEYVECSTGLDLDALQLIASTE